MDEKKLAKDTLTHFKLDLLENLPLESYRFLAKLEAAKLLPDNTSSMIQAKATREEKVSYFLENIVSAVPDIYLPILIDIMEKEDDNIVLNYLAGNMNKYMTPGNILVCMMALSEINTYMWGSIRSILCIYPYVGLTGSE